MIATVEAGDKKCRGLALSGGGSNGAWEAGVIWGLQNSGNPEDYAWNVITGVSAGSMAAAGMAGFGLDEGQKAAQFLSETWARQLNMDVWTLWNGKGPILGCLTEPSCLNDEPMLN